MYVVDYKSRWCIFRGTALLESGMQCPALALGWEARLCLPGSKHNYFAIPTKIGEYVKHYLDKIALPPKAWLRKTADSALPIAVLLDFVSLSNKRPTP